MKISAIETIRIDEFPNLLWVQVFTDDGIIGLGETFYGPGAAEAPIHETIAPKILNKICILDLDFLCNRYLTMKHLAKNLLSTAFLYHLFFCHAFVRKS